jgi:hypothetical protein
MCCRWWFGWGGGDLGCWGLVELVLGALDRWGMGFWFGLLGVGFGEN